MVLPIYGYGESVLRKKAQQITKDYPELETLIANMYQTMYNAQGVGLAAPQVGLPIRLFIVDTVPFSESDDLSKEEKDQLKKLKKTFINATIVQESGDRWIFNEGCLSIPDVREDVARLDQITIEYYDESFNFHKETYSGIAARVIQHEYDHIEGILFVDKISTLRKKMISKKLKHIMEGKIRAPYKMKLSKIKIK